MILSHNNNICLTHKLLEGIRDTIEFISNVCSLYFEINTKILIDILNSYYIDEIEYFISQNNTSRSIFVHFIYDPDSNTGNFIEPVYKILVTGSIDKYSSDSSYSIGFYKSSASLKEPDKTNNHHQNFKSSPSNEKFILLPIFFNDRFPLAHTLPGYLSNLLIPIYKCNSQMCIGDTAKEQKHNISKKLDELSNIMKQTDDNIDIDYFNFQMCNSLKAFMDPRTEIINIYEIKIKEEFILEDIKSNVREWSSEMVRIIREYVSKFSEDYEEDENLLLSESSSEYDSDMTSGSTTSPDESIFSMSFLRLKTSKMKHVDTKMMDDITNYIELMCSNRIDFLEENNFWLSYHKVLVHLIEKVESQNFVNTLLLLEYNGVSVDNIYSFEESIKLVKQILIDTNETNSFMSGMNLGNIVKVDKLTDIHLIIENIFTHIRKYIHIKYLKNDRFGLLFKGIVVQIICSICRVIAIELKHYMFEENYNIMIKTVRILYELKNKMVNLDKYFEKNKIHVKPCDNNLLILLDLYKDILQSFCKCNMRFGSLNSDIGLLISYISEDADLNDDSKGVCYNSYGNTVGFYSRLNTIATDLTKTYNIFVENLIYHHTKINEQMVNILNLDDVITSTKKDIDDNENIFIESIKNYLDSLDMFEVVTILNTIHSLSISNTKNLFGYKTDNYIDDIIEEYDRILYDIDNPYIELDGEMFSKLIIKERIMNLVDIVEVISNICSKSILKTIKNNLNELSNRYINMGINVQNSYSLNLRINIVKNKELYILSVDSEIDYKEQISNLSILSCDNDYIFYEQVINCMYFVDQLISYCNYVDSEKIKDVDGTISLKNPFIEQLNWSITSIMEAINDNKDYLIHNGIMNRSFFKFVKSLNDYAILTSLFLGVYKRFDYLLKYEEPSTENYKNEITLLLSHIDKVVIYVVNYTGINIRIGYLNSIIVSIIEKYGRRLLEEWSEHNLRGIDINHYEVKFTVKNRRLKIEPSIEHIRIEYYSNLSHVLDECNELLLQYTIDGYDVSKDIDVSSNLATYIKLIEDTLFDVEEEFQHWSLLLSESKLNLINPNSSESEHNNIIAQIEKIIESSHNINDSKIIDFISITLPKEEYIKKIENIKKVVLKDIEHEKTLCKTHKYFIELEEICDNVMIEFIVTDHGKYFNTYSISNTEAIYKILLHHVGKLNIVKSSNFNETLNSLSIKWIKEFQKIKLFIEDCNIFSNKINKLINISTCKFIDFNDLLPTIYQLNDDIKIISTVSKLAHVGDYFTSLISSMIERADSINQIISKQLNDIRYVCPRLYFINDNDLIEITGDTDIEIHLSKIFPGISFLIKNNKLVSGIISCEGEKLIFEQELEYIQSYNIKFINELHLSIKNNLKRLFKLALCDLYFFYSDYKFDEESFVIWIKAYPLQNLILSISLCWTESMELCTNQSDTERLYLFISNIAEWLLVHANEYDDLTGKKIQQLLFKLDYQLNKMNDLKLYSINSLKWMKCIRYYLSGDEVQLKIMNRVYNYGFNYMFNFQKMIVTTVTDHFYNFSSLVLNCNLLPSAQGPAGTGKTETIKSLACLAGSNMLVFNFSELYQVEDIEKILSGLSMLGFWGVFDEFNRLSECVLSSITETIEQISNSNNTNIRLLDKNIEINPDMAYFITMNPGYTGRSELPLNCIQLCQQFMMEELNLYSIIKVNLKLHWFENPENLCHEIIFILDSFNLIFTSIEYDFGLRFIKYAFNFINFLKSNCISTDSKNNYHGKEMLYQSLNRLLLPRMLTSEILLYKYITSYDNELLYNDDEYNFLKILKNTDLDEYLIFKALEIYRMVTISSSIILFGKPSSGKSKAFEYFIQSIRFTREIELVSFDPNSLTTSELYGHRVDDKWIEGLIPSILKSHIDKNLFILFDGEIKQEWVENLNSLLDDNKILTLSNGERIPLNDNIKLFFETDSLDSITPATISRSTVIKFEQNFSNQNIKYLDVANTYFNQEDNINLLINNSKSFVIQYQNSSGVTSYFKQIQKNHSIHVLYLSSYIESNDIIKYLLSICHLNENTSVLGSKHEFKTVILIKDIYDINDRSHCTSIYAILRQILINNYFYKYNIKKSQWDKIYLDEIVFVFFKVDDSNSKCRLLSRLPLITLYNVKNYNNLTEFNKKINDMYNKQISSHDFSLIESISQWDYRGWFILKLFQVRYSDDSSKLSELIKEHYDIKCEYECVTDRFFVKSDCTIKSYQFIYLFLLFNKSFLCILGPCVSGKRYLSFTASINLGLDFIDINDKSKDEIISLIIKAGNNDKKFTFFINMDLLLSTKFKFYCIIKHLIYKEYSLLFDGNKIRELLNKHSPNSSFDDFNKHFFNNINENIRFILTGNEIEKSMLNRGIVCKIRDLNYEELVSSSKSIIPVSSNMLADIYSMCKELTCVKFIDFVFMLKMTKHWNYVLNDKHNKILNHHSQGIEKIASFKSELNHLEKTLNITKEKLNEKNIELERKIKYVSHKQIECEESRKIAISLTESLNGRKSILEDKKSKIKYQIDNIAPMIEKAKQDVENINKKSLEELKTMHNPPFIVKYTIETVLTVLENKIVKWEETRKILKSSDFISKIVSYDIEHMSENIYDILKQRSSISQWNINRIIKASKAAGPLAKWVNSVIECYEIHKQILPLMKEVEEIEQETYNNEITLTEQNSLIHDLQLEIERHNRDYSKIKDESIAIRNDIEVTEDKLSVSKRIIEDLSDELTRWNDKIINIQREVECVIPNSIIESLLPIYVSLSYNSRDLFIEKCFEIFTKNHFDYSFNLNKISNVEKYVIEKNDKFKHVIILDSDDSEFLSLIQEPYTQVSAADENFCQILESVKSISGRLLIKDIHCCDANIKNIILNEFRDKIDNDSDFNIYLISTNEFFRNNNDSDNRIVESILNRSLVINMKKHGEYFIHFAKHKLIEKLEPDLHSLFIYSNINISKLNLEINLNETMLLDKLINSNIFDPKFIEFMDNYKKTTYQLDSEIRLLESSDKKYFSCIESYTDLIQLICDIYLEIEKLSDLSKLYFFDFNIIFHFAHSLRISETHLSDIIISSYNWIDKGLFHSDKLFWGIGMLKILSRYNIELKGNMDYLIHTEYNIDSQNVLNKLINDYLRSDKFDSMIYDYYNTIVLLTDVFQDPTFSCQFICNKLNKKLDKYAVGSVSEMNKLKNCIIASLKLSNCVLIKNIHLSKAWINKIETEFINKYPDTKIFLTCDKKIELSKNMLLSCHKITCELSNLKLLILHLFDMFKKEFYDTTPFSFILLKCIFIHSIIFIRQLYVPYGWSRNYNFNINDLTMILRTSKSIFHDDGPPYTQDIIRDLNELVMDIYSAKISDYIDLRILEDIITLSNQRFNIYEPIQLEHWIDNNSMDDEFQIIGFTKYTQLEIFKLRNRENKPKIEFKMGDVYSNYAINSKCQIFNKYFTDETGQLTSKSTSEIDPEDHRNTLEKICRLLDGDNDININLNHLISPTRFISLLKFPFSLNQHTGPSELELIVTIGAGNTESTTLFEGSNSFTINASLYNGTYVENENYIDAGTDCEELHILKFNWIPKNKLDQEPNFHICFIPLYKYNGLVCIY